MSKLTYPDQTNSFNELRLITKSLVFLALLTGLIYLRVFLIEIWPMMRADGFVAVEVAKLVLLVVAMLGLLVTLRREDVGGVTAVLTGLLFGILVYTTTRQSPLLLAFFYSSPFIISGGLSLACWRQARRGEAVHGT